MCLVTLPAFNGSNFILWQNPVHIFCLPQYLQDNSSFRFLECYIYPFLKALPWWTLYYNMLHQPEPGLRISGRVKHYALFIVLVRRMDHDTHFRGQEGLLVYISSHGRSFTSWPLPLFLLFNYLLSRTNRSLHVSPTSDPKILHCSHFSSLNTVPFLS